MFDPNSFTHILVSHTPTKNPSTQLARVFPAAAPLMVQLASNRRHWHALYVAELAAGTSPSAAARTRADRSAERSRAASRQAAFDAAYAAWLPREPEDPVQRRRSNSLTNVLGRRRSNSGGSGGGGDVAAAGSSLPPPSRPARATMAAAPTGGRTVRASSLGRGRGGGAGDVERGGA